MGELGRKIEHVDAGFRGGAGGIDIYISDSDDGDFRIQGRKIGHPWFLSNPLGTTITLAVRWVNQRTKTYIDAFTCSAITKKCPYIFL